MTDSATSRYLARKQSLGSNTNTWGDAKLNDDLDLFDRGSKGYQSSAITADTTLTWTNYSTSNTGQVANWKITGSLTSTTTITVPSVEWVWDMVWNTTGASITMKCSGGTGVTIPTGRKAKVFSDGTDCYFSVPNYLGDDISEANSRDIADKAYVDTAVATATIPATTGTVLVSGSDTTASYLYAAFTTSPSSPLTLSIANAAANEQVLIAIGSLALTDGGTKTSGFTAVVNSKYNCAFTANGTITLPSSATAGDIIEFGLGGPYVYTLNPNGLKINSSTANLPVVGNQSFHIKYTSATDGWG